MWDVHFHVFVSLKINIAEPANDSQNNKETVDYKNIVSKNTTNVNISREFEDTEIPSLIWIRLNDENGFFVSILM